MYYIKVNGILSGLFISLNSAENMFEYICTSSLFNAETMFVTLETKGEVIRFA